MSSSSLSHGGTGGMSKLMKRQADLDAKKEKHAEKLAKQNAKAEAAEKAREQKQPEKRKLTLISTAEKKRKREKQAYEGEDLADTAAKVRQEPTLENELAEPREIPAGQARFTIIQFLQKQPDYAPMSFVAIRQAVGIDIEAHASLEESMHDNLKVEVVGERELRFRPPYGVRDSAALLHLLQGTRPGAANGQPEAVGRWELTVNREEEPAGPSGASIGKKAKEKPKVYETFQDIEEQIDKLIADGRITRIARTQMPGQGRNQTETLYSSMPMDGGVALCDAPQASPDMRALWDKVTVPKGTDLQKALLKRKVRSLDELQVREQRAKMSQDQRRKEKEEAKKAKKEGHFRTVTNVHLLQEDPSLFNKRDGTSALRGNAAKIAAQGAQRPQ